MLRTPKNSKNEVVAPKEEEEGEKGSRTYVCFKNNLFCVVNNTCFGRLPCTEINKQIDK